MLTPAEELGLSGLSLASKVRRAFDRIPDDQLTTLINRIREESLARHLVYLRDGEPDAVHVMPCPLTALPDQIAYIHYVTVTIQNALKRLPDLYFTDDTVRKILQLPGDEEAFVREYWSPGHRENNPIFGRYDAVVDFISPMWKETLKFLEPNLGSIGGLHFVPTAERIVADLIFPEIQSREPRVRLEIGQDIRDLLMQDILDHLENIGRPARTICLVDPKYVGSGPDEQSVLTEYYQRRYEMRVSHADPSELTLSGDEVRYENEPIDLIYRDYGAADLLELERQGGDIRPIRSMFKQNRVVSSVASELDQKSCWEILTDPRLSAKYFSADERQVFRRHILWTRLVYPRVTDLPDGQPGDLIPYVRDEHETLVLKPNCSYGGRGVHIGSAMTKAEWEAAIDSALADSERWVVQQVTNIPVSDFPVLAPDGEIHIEPFYVVMGFAPSKYGLATLVRASQKQVVNVAQRGGLCVIAQGHAPGKLLGPRQRN